uniref:Serine/threonine-protein kinase PLK1 n=1 Tax=Zosterops lateralis melanops TaxID=1220523 RepID=A0A8D2PM91_ZOSLA
MPGTREQAPGLRCCCCFCVVLGYFSLVLELRLGNIPRSFLLASGAQEAALGVLQTLGWGAWGRGLSGQRVRGKRGRRGQGQPLRTATLALRGSGGAGVCAIKTIPKNGSSGIPLGTGRTWRPRGAGGAAALPLPGKPTPGLAEAESREVFAGKVVPKSLLVKPHQKEKMSMEIAIHRSLSHRHVVGFQSFFEDDDFVYVVLELCRRRSLLELHKRRKALSEPEVRYYLRQTILGCQYLHSHRVIHRDLKLGNLFLSDDMEVKIGDFGLATKVEYDGERKKTLCGTPNYIAPEVLGKKGHSFEVDIWSIGCIMYTLLVGKPPFETSCLKDTYIRIKKNEYTIPKHINPVAANLIQKMLRSDPAARPTIDELLNDEFFTSGYLPGRLPTSCLTIAPRFSLAPSGMELSGRKPLTALNKGLDSPAQEPLADKEEAAGLREVGDAVSCHLADMLQQLTAVNAAKPSERVPVRQGELEALWGPFWAGYQLCDNSVGVLFNDSTRLIMYNDGDNLQYIEQNNTESYFNVRSYPSALNKKITLLKYFRNYMSEHLLKAGANITPREGDELARLPYLSTWFRTRSAIILHLSNGTVQINFFQDHTKVILCPLMAAVTYIDEKRDFCTYKLSLIEEHGCCRELASRLRYARTMVEKLLSSKSGSGRMKASS